MKKLLIALVCLTLISFSAAAEDGRSVTLKNGSGYDFYYLYISPSNWDNWESDLLTGDYLTDGETRTFILSSEYGDECLYDIKAVDLDDDTYTMYEADICSKEILEINMEHYDEDNYDEGPDDYGGYDEGYQEGYSTGFRDAYSDAYRQGYSDGFSDGQSME